MKSNNRYGRFVKKAKDDSDFQPDFKSRKPGRKNKGKGAGCAGRPVSLGAKKLALLLEAYYTHPYSFRELADMFGVSRMTVWRAVQDATLVADPGARY